jgi:hypothetical protein
MIWANYDINPDGKYDKDFENISANYLGAKIADLVGMPLTGYQKFLIELNEEIPVLTSHGYLDKEGNYYSLETTTEDILQTYNYLVYNNQFDRKKTVEDFFYLK